MSMTMTNNDYDDDEWSYVISELLCNDSGAITIDDNDYDYDY